MENENMINAIEGKAKVIRDGSCSRTADELAATYISDICNLLECEQVAIPEDSEALTALVQEMEQKSLDGGFDTVWSDGYIIYKDLTNEEAEYVNCWDI